MQSCSHAVSSHAAHLCHQLRLLLGQVVVLWYKVARLLPNFGLELFVAVPQFVLPVQSGRGRETIDLEKRKERLNPNLHETISPP